MDEDLPGLEMASDPVVVDRLLRESGLVEAVASAEPVRLTVRSARPGRRAVVEAAHPGLAAGRVFLKVCRPQVLSRVRRRYTLVASSAAPSPQVLATLPAGVLVLSALPGEGLREALRRGGAEAIDPAALVEVLDALPSSLLGVARRRSWTDNVAWYAASIGDAQPTEARRAAALADRIESLPDADAADLVPSHGDFYESQVLVSRGRVTGLLDLDGAGPGRREDDLACALAHLVLLEHLAWVRDRPAEAARFASAAKRWQDHFLRDPRVGEEALRTRTAGVLLSLATGPRRVDEADWPAATSARLDLVESCLP